MDRERVCPSTYTKWHPTSPTLGKICSQKQPRHNYNTHNNWSKLVPQPQPLRRSFPRHVITHFKADTIIYDEPTIPPELRIEPRIESRDIRVLCIHHKTTSLGPREYASRMDTIGNTLQIPNVFNTTAPSTPINTSINRSKKWSQLMYPPPPPMTQNTNTPIITNQDICIPLKYQP